MSAIKETTAVNGTEASAARANTSEIGADTSEARTNISETFKEQVCRYARLMDEKGLVNPVEGNLSVMDRATGYLYITPSGLRKRYIDVDKVAVLDGSDGSGTQIGGSMRRSSEYLLHLEALKARPDCAAVAHMHAPYLTAYAFCNKDIEIKCSTTFSLLFEKIPCLPYGEPGTIHIADGIGDAIREYDLILLANHGCVAVGPTLEDACKLVEAAEEVLRTYHIARSIGEVSDIPEKLLESMYENHPASRRNRRRLSD